MIVSWKETEKSYYIYQKDNEKIKQIVEFEIIEKPNQLKEITIRNTEGKMEFCFCDSKPETVRLIAEALMEVYKQSQEAKETNP